MQRTQISLTSEDRKLLDAEAARTGRSISALIRHAVNHTYGSTHDSTNVIATIDYAFGAWGGGASGEDYVDGLRSGSRLDDATR